MHIIQTRGNQQLMKREKTLFICSKKTPISLYEKVFKWTDSLSDKDCIACFNTTEMESEVLKALLVAKVPTILFVMNRFTDVNNLQIKQALQEDRLLIVVLKRDEPYGLAPTPWLRNKYVLSICQHVVCGYINKNGSVFGLLAGREGVVHLVCEYREQTAAEADVSHLRWTVAQDKVMLRMFYSDMGIHAIQKKLHRSYVSIYLRLLSITQSETLLKGREFEDYVLDLFNVQESDDLVLLEWQSDKSHGLLRPENNKNPDFVFRFKQSEFAVECKWRGKLREDFAKDLFEKRRIDNYKKFSEVRNMKVTILLGVGGVPSNPDFIYRIPLNNVDAIVGGKQPISDFLYDENSFDIFNFL